MSTSVPVVSTSNKYHPERLHATLRRFFEANNIPVVDLLPTIADMDPGDLVVNSCDAHPNERAHQLYADAIWEAFYASPH